jgi:hypothetical protein
MIQNFIPINHHVESQERREKEAYEKSNASSHLPFHDGNDSKNRGAISKGREMTTKNGCHNSGAKTAPTARIAPVAAGVRGFPGTPAFEIATCGTAGGLIGGCVGSARSSPGSEIHTPASNP